MPKSKTPRSAGRAENSEPEHVVGRPFPKGKSGNPGGRPLKLRELDDLIQREHGPRVPALLERLYEMATGDGREAVPAAKEWLDRVLGKARTRQDERPLPTIAEVRSALEVRDQAVRVVAREVASLEAAARERALSPEEAAALCNYVRVLSPYKPEDVSDEDLRRIAGDEAASEG